MSKSRKDKSEAQIVDEYIEAGRLISAADDDNPVHWHDAALEANHWCSLKSLDPTRAALLLCGFNPHKDDEQHARDVTTQHVRYDGDERRVFVGRPANFIRLVERFRDEAAADPRPRALHTWRVLAGQHNMTVHPWFDEYVAAGGRAEHAAELVADRVEQASDPNERAELAELAAVQAPTQSTPQHSAQQQFTLITDDVCAAFDGIGLSSLQWRVMLTKNRPDWLTRCRQQVGARGTIQSRWSLVGIADALVRGRSRKAGAVPVQTINKAFNSRPLLKAGREAWRGWRMDHPDLGD